MSLVKLSPTFGNLGVRVIFQKNAFLKMLPARQISVQFPSTDVLFDPFSSIHTPPSVYALRQTLDLDTNGPGHAVETEHSVSSTWICHMCRSARKQLGRRRRTDRCVASVRTRTPNPFPRRRPRREGRYSTHARERHAPHLASKYHLRGIIIPQ